MIPLITRPPDNYLPPSKFEIDACRERFKLGVNGKGSEELEANLRDLSNLYAHGQFLEQSDIELNVKEVATKNFPLSCRTSEGKWHVPDHGLFNDRNAGIKTVSLRLSAITEERIRGLSKIDLKEVPGNSPLERACFLARLMKNNLPDQALADSVNRIMKRIKSLDPQEMILLKAKGKASKNPELEDEEDEEDDTEVSGGTEDVEDEVKDLPDDLLLQKLEVAENISDEHLIWLDISRKLEHSPSFLSFRETEIKANVEGEEIRCRPIESVDEMQKLTHNEWALPEIYRFYRIAAQEAVVREHIVREEKKQLLYLLVDSSGSMAEGNRLYKAAGVVMNRLKAVIKEDAVCYLRFFAGCLGKTRYYAEDKTGAEALMGYIKEHNFNGGDTDIDGAVKGCLEDIETLMAEEKLLVRPDLVLITDGCAPINLLPKDFGVTTFHLILLQASRKSVLEDLARATGGISVRL